MAAAVPVRRANLAGGYFAQLRFLHRTAMAATDYFRLHGVGVFEGNSEVFACVTRILEIHEYYAETNVERRGAVVLSDVLDEFTRMLLTDDYDTESVKADQDLCRLSSDMIKNSDLEEEMRNYVITCFETYQASLLRTLEFAQLHQHH